MSADAVLIASGVVGSGGHSVHPHPVQVGANTFGHLTDFRATAPQHRRGNRKVEHQHSR